MTILVTGGTGTLGRPTVDLLRKAGHDVRILSRTAGEGRAVGDLRTGAGLDAALAGVDTVMHLATSASSKDVGQARLLMAAAAKAGVRCVALRCGGWWNDSAFAGAAAIYDSPHELLAAYDASPLRQQDKSKN